MSARPEGAASFKARLWTAAQVVFGLAGLAFLVVTLVETWDRAEGDALPAAWRLAVAFPLAVLSLVFSARGWTALLGGGSRRLVSGFFLAQLGKYMPGAVWQVAGQVGFAARDGVGMGRASVAFPVHALSLVAAAGVMALVFALTATSRYRWLGLLGVLVVPLLHRGWMVAGVRFAMKLRNRGADGDPGDFVPPQRAILEAAAWGFGTLVTGGAGFAVLATGVDAPGSVLVPAWGVAWALGFLALLFPAGLGAREAVLVLAIGGAGSTALVISASIAHRIVTMLAEVATIGVSQALGRRERSREASTPVP